MSVQGIEKSKSMVEESQSNDSDTFLLSARRYSTSSVRKTSERDFVSIYDSNSSCGAKACPLQWWRTHSEWSNLQTLARRMLTAQATSVACEFLFSVCGYMEGKRRQRLKPENMRKLVLLNRWKRFRMKYPL